MPVDSFILLNLVWPCDFLITNRMQLEGHWVSSKARSEEPRAIYHSLDSTLWRKPLPERRSMTLRSGSPGSSPACQCRRLRFDPWVGTIPWRKKGQLTAGFLPGESHGWRSLVGSKRAWGCKESDTTEPLTLTYNLSIHVNECTPP